MSKYAIRPAEGDDLTTCLTLDDSYQTEWVWQVIESHSDMLLGEVGMAGEQQRTVSFRPNHLPRQRLVAGKYATPHRLRADWQQTDYFSVAITDDDDVVGYVNLYLDRQRECAWLTQLAVADKWRRQRVGTALLEDAREWARLAGQRALLIEVPTANYPASRFLQSQGFAFSGYSEAFNPDGEVVLLFSYPLG